jgi:hypothetical protein
MAVAKALHRGRRYLQAVVAVVLLGSAFAAVSVASSDAGTTSLPLVGRFLSISNFRGPSCPTSVCSSFRSIGVVNGSGIVAVDGFFAQPPGASSAHTTIHTDRGDLMCSDLAIFDLSPGDHPFVDLCTISGGTGHYAGATGYFQEAGTFDFANNVGQATYTGKLVLP